MSIVTMGSIPHVNSLTRELPRYQCHKQVHALKVAQLMENPRGFELHFEDQSYVPMQFPHEWIVKHAAHAGGYFVWYADGHKSFSPADAFEAGYTLIEEPQ